MSASVSYHWTPNEYINLVEKTNNPMLKRFQEEEASFIQICIANKNQKTIIDVGAGYGRILPAIADVNQIIAIELDENLFSELEKKAAKYSNLQIVKADANRLSSIIKDKTIINPVVLLIQNSLGTWIGDYKTVLKEMKRVAKNGELILSLFCQEGLKSEGIDMYKTLIPLVGEPDFEATDVAKGIFRSKTGYKSQWWTKQQREEILRILGGKVTNELQRKSYYFVHIKY